jgi:large subunit ribosomal protein L10
MPNLVTELVSQKLEQDLGRSEGMIVVAFGGLTVSQSESLRGQLAEKGVRLRMVRNKLARRVLLRHGHDFPADALVGNVAIAMGDAESAIVAAKVLTSPEVRKVGKVTVRGGLMEGRVLGARDAELLADIPDKDTLRAKILGCLNGPARGLVVSLNGLPSGLARVLQAHLDDAGGAPAEPAGGASAGTPASDQAAAPAQDEAAAQPES